MQGTGHPGRLWCLVTWAYERQATPAASLDGLKRALAQARAFAPPARIVLALLERDRPWWAPLLAEHPPENVIEQPFDRGSGTAVLMGALLVVGRDVDAQLLILGNERGRVGARSLVELFKERAPELIDACTSLMTNQPSRPGALDAVYPQIECVEFASIRPEH